MDWNWSKNEHANSESYFDGENAVIIWIIQTGFEGVYIVTFDDAEEVLLGQTFILNKKQIKEKYGISIQI